MKTLRMAILGAAALLMAWVSASAYADFAAYSEVVNLAAETTDVRVEHWPRLEQCHPQRTMEDDIDHEKSIYGRE